MTLQNENLNLTNDPDQEPGGEDLQAAEQPERTSWLAVAIATFRRRLNENFIYATIGGGIIAAIFGTPSLPILRSEFIIVLVLILLSVGWITYEVWKARRGGYEPGGVVAAVVKWAVGLFTSRPWVQRIVAAAVVVAIVGGGLAYTSWAAVNKALANSHMDGDVNVLVATLHDQDAGTQRASGTSRQVSEWLEDSLQTQFGASGEDRAVAVKLVDDVVSGSTADANDQASSLGAKYAAHLVIYGEVLQRADGSIFITPRVTFTGKDSADLTDVELAEVAGAGALGEAIGPIDLEESAPALSERSELLVQFVVGLVSLVHRNPEAADAFRAVIRNAEELRLPPNAVLQYFLGSGLLIAHTPDSYEAARAAFERALAIRPDYARAQVGLANTLYLQATLARPEDETLLTQAAYIYEGALGGLEQAEGPVLAARARIGLGNTYFLLAQNAPQEYENKARRQYAMAVQLSEGCRDSLGWWDPRRYRPLRGRFHSEPAYCDQLSKLGAVARGLIDDSTRLLRTPIVVPTTNGPPGSAHATVDSIAAKVGQVASVRVKVIYANEPGLSAWELNLAYDPILLSPKECIPELAGTVCNLHYDDMTIRMAGASATGLFGQLVVARLQFECADAGTSSLDVVVDVLADATIGGPRPINATTEGGSVTCLP